MLNNITFKKPEKREFELLPEEVYEVVISSIEEGERVVYQHPDEKEEIIKFTFEIEEGEYKGRKLWKDCSPIMWPGSDKGSPSTLYLIYSAGAGKKLSMEECEFVGLTEINELEGKKLRAIVIQKKSSKGELVNKVDGFLPIKGMKITESEEGLVNAEISSIEYDDAENRSF